MISSSGSPDQAFIRYFGRIQFLVTFMTIALSMVAFICGSNIRFGFSCQLCTYFITKEVDENIMLFMFHPSFYYLFLPIFASSIVAYAMEGMKMSSYSFQKQHHIKQEILTQHQQKGSLTQVAPIFLRKERTSKLAHFRRILYSWFIGGSPKSNWWSFLLVALPAIIVCLEGMWSAGAGFEQVRYGLAQASGYAAVAALSLFMVPVSRQSILLSAIGWSPVHDALTVHIWAGYVCVVCTLIHVILFTIIYGTRVWFPPRHCFRAAGIGSFRNEADVNAGCYIYIRNFTGLISVTALILLTLTSFARVRKWSYRLFYYSHLVTGTIMLLFAIIHWWYIVLYILPSLLYYFCTTSPTMIQMFAGYFIDKGSKLEESTIIGKSNGCAEMVFPKTAISIETENKQSSPYVRICVPEISMIWHPFTVASNHDKTKLRILFRQYGHFTTELLNRLQNVNRSPPIILIDGYYFGKDWVHSALSSHDEVLLVAGGIGITPFLSMIRMLFDNILSLDNCFEVRLSRIQFHWFCRDEGLIHHVLINHFSYFIRKCRESYLEQQKSNNGKESCDALPFSIQIMIHFTGRQVEDTTPFHIREPKILNFTEEDGLRYVSSTNTQDENGTCTTSSQTNSSSPENSLPNKSSEASFNDLSLFEDQHPALLNVDISGITTTNTSETVNIIRSNVKETKLSITEGTPLNNQLNEGETYVRTYPNNQGVCVDPPRTFWCFCFSFLGGLYIHWKIYLNYVAPYRHAFFVRAYSTYSAFLWSILVAIINEIVHRARCHFSSKSLSKVIASSEQYQPGSISQLNQSSNATNTGSEPSIADIEFPFHGQIDGKLQIEISVRNGRPLLEDVVYGVVNANQPGAFFCGPSKLWHNVQDRICKGRRDLKGRFCPKCCFYAEDFGS